MNKKCKILLTVAVISTIVYSYTTYQQQRLYKAGIEYFTQEEFDESIRILKTLLNSNEKNKNEINDQLKLIEEIKASKLAFEEGNYLKLKKKYVEAIEAFMAVSENDEKRYSAAQTKIADCKSNYINSNIEIAKNKLTSQQYELALASINSVLVIQGNNKEALKLQAEYNEAIKKGTIGSETVSESITKPATRAVTNVKPASSPPASTGGNSKPESKLFYITGENSINNQPFHYVYKSGDWMYYVDSKENALSKIKLDGTQKTIIVKTEGSYSYVKYINVVGNWIYFVENSKRIYKVKTDGTNLTLLPISDSIRNLIVWDNKLYFIKGIGGVIYTADLDGSNLESLGHKQKLRAFFASMFMIRDNQLFFTDNSSNNIFRVNLDGTYLTQVTDIPSYNFNVEGNWVYYKDKSDHLYRSSIYGKDLHHNGSVWEIPFQKTEKILESRINRFIVHNGWIYYNEYEYNNWDFYKITVSGSDKTKLGAGSGIFHVIGDTIFHIGNGISLRNLDGTIISTLP